MMTNEEVDAKIKAQQIKDLCVTYKQIIERAVEPQHQSVLISLFENLMDLAVCQGKIEGGIAVKNIFNKGC